MTWRIFFAIIPAMLISLFPEIAPLNIMGLRSPQSAILSAVIFNALIIVALIPLALRVSNSGRSACLAFKAKPVNLWAGRSGRTFVGIKLIDMLMGILPWS